MPLIRRDVAEMLSQIHCEIAEAEAMLRDGSGREKARAAGRLSLLHRQQAMLDRRLADIDAHPEAHENALQWIKEELFSLSLGFERWLASGS